MLRRVTLRSMHACAKCWSSVSLFEGWQRVKFHGLPRGIPLLGGKKHFLIPSRNSVSRIDELLYYLNFSFIHKLHDTRMRVLRCKDVFSLLVDNVLAHFTYVYTFFCTDALRKSDIRQQSQPMQSQPYKIWARPRCGLPWSGYQI